MLASVLLADLEVERAARCWTENLRLERAPEEMPELRKAMLADVVTWWQERWDGETAGRELIASSQTLGKD